MTAAPRLFKSYKQLDKQLTAAGFPPTSKWWMRQLGRFYAHRTALRLVGRVGRGGDKSTQSVKVSVNETLFGNFAVPQGERHYYTFVSENREEAAMRLRLIEAYLGALGVRFQRSGDTVDLVDMPRGWKVLACRVGAVSGWRCFGYCADEAAKWKAGEQFQNPAQEVITSLESMTATHSQARSLVISSPLSVLDYHAELFDKGDTEHQVACWAESWVANPGAITEAQCWAKAKGDRRIFDREFRAIPQAGVSSAFDSDAIDAAFDVQQSELLVQAKPVLSLDPSRLRGDAFACAVVGWLVPDKKAIAEKRARGENVTEPKAILRVHAIKAYEGRMIGRVTTTDVVDDFARLGKEWGCDSVFSDQCEDASLAAMFNGRHAMHFKSFQWTAERKGDAVVLLRRLMAERTLSICSDDGLRRQLHAFSEKVSASGVTQFHGRGQHDDHVATLITAAMAEAERFLPSSPVFGRPPLKPSVGGPLRVFGNGGHSANAFDCLRVSEDQTTVARAGRGYDSPYWRSGGGGF